LDRVEKLKVEGLKVTPCTPTVHKGAGKKR
jgi:hypothetical protein